MMICIEYVKLYLHSTILLHGIVLNLVQGLFHLYMIQSSERPFQESNRVLPSLEAYSHRVIQEIAGHLRKPSFSIVFKKGRHWTVG